MAWLVMPRENRLLLVNWNRRSTEGSGLTASVVGVDPSDVGFT